MNNFPTAENIWFVEAHTCFQLFNFVCLAVISLKVSAKFTRNKFKNKTVSYLLTSYIISICRNDQNVESSTVPHLKIFEETSLQLWIKAANVLTIFYVTYAGVRGLLIPISTMVSANTILVISSLLVLLSTSMLSLWGESSLIVLQVWQYMVSQKNVRKGYIYNLACIFLLRASLGHSVTGNRKKNILYLHFECVFSMSHWWISCLCINLLIKTKLEQYPRHLTAPIPGVPETNVPLDLSLS